MFFSIMIVLKNVLMELIKIKIFVNYVLDIVFSAKMRILVKHVLIILSLLKENVYTSVQEYIMVRYKLLGTMFKHIADLVM